MYPRSMWFALTLATFALTSGVHAEVGGGSKRIPSGFMGMRGKKDAGDFNDAGYYVDVPQSYGNAIDDDMFLHRPLADLFYGYPDHAKRAPVGFQGMRGKKNYLMDTGGPYDDIFGEYTYASKRAPLGFQGMRGKREDEYASYSDKRAPIGFQGMRGKKDVDDNETNEDEPQIRSTQETTTTTIGEEDPRGGGANELTFGGAKQRRAANIGFYGVRGKKMPASFFGTRGKKGPFDYPFRGKFVGVRGKKFAPELGYNMPYDEGFEKRKGPSGFMGMRGKKWVSESSDYSGAGDMTALGED